MAAGALLIARSGLLGKVPAFEGQRTVIHHRNFDESDNRAENLEFMGNQDHSRLHRSIVERNTYWQSEAFEAKRKAALSAKAHTPEGHAYFAARGAANLRRYWRERPEVAKANCAGNGERGKAFLVAKTERGGPRQVARTRQPPLYLRDLSSRSALSHRLAQPSALAARLQSSSGFRCFPRGT